jgi:hypothetical protein
MTYISGERADQWNAEDAQASKVLSRWDDEAVALLQEADVLAKQLEAKLKAVCELNHAAEDALIYLENVTVAIPLAIQEITE